MAARKKTAAKKAPAKKARRTRVVPEGKCGAMPSTRAMKAQEQKWQAEDDVRTLMRAQEIQADQARMSRAQKVAKQQAAEASRVANRINKTTAKRTAKS